jgi:hypothetical protein
MENLGWWTGVGGIEEYYLDPVEKNIPDDDAVKINSGQHRIWMFELFERTLSGTLYSGQNRKHGMHRTIVWGFGKMRNIDGVGKNLKKEINREKNVNEI